MNKLRKTSRNQESENVISKSQHHFNAATSTLKNFSKVMTPGLESRHKVSMSQYSLRVVTSHI